jgi:hypothetical protein
LTDGRQAVIINLIVIIRRMIEVAFFISRNLDVAGTGEEF